MNIEQRVQRLEARLRKRWCAHENLLVLQLPLWMRTTQIPAPGAIKNLTEPVPSKPIARKCLLCGLWLQVPNPFEPSLQKGVSEQDCPHTDSHVP